MKQKQLADLARLHPNALLEIEKGRSDPRPESIERIAAALGVEITVIEEEAKRGPQMVRERAQDYVTALRPSEREVVPLDLLGHPVMNDVELIFSWLPEEMSKRLAGKVNYADRVAEAYAYGSAEGWSADRLDFVHKVGQRVRAVQRGDDFTPGS